VETAEERLKPAILFKRRELVQKVFVCNKSTVILTVPVQLLKPLKVCTLMWYLMLVHSPDLTPSDSHFYGLLREALRGKNFRSDCEVKNAVYDWLNKQPLKLSFDGNHGLFRDGKQASQEGEPVSKFKRLFCQCHCFSFVFAVFIWTTPEGYVETFKGSTTISIGLFSWFTNKKYPVRLKRLSNYRLHCFYYDTR
jgi:hypothetical protein